MSSTTKTRLALGFLLFGSISAFVIQSTQPSLKATTFTSSRAEPTFLYSQKKRRRRKQNPSSPSTSDSVTSPVVNPTDDETDELPDFDLVEDVDLEEQAEAQARAAASAGSPGVAPSSTNINVNDPEVMAAMRATTGSQAMSGASTKDLIRSRNRDLEQRLVVNDIVEDVPSLADYTSSKGSSAGAGGIGKKAARREARRTAAIEALPDEPEESFFDKLPFFKKNEEKEEKSPIKVCHYLL